MKGRYFRKSLRLPDYDYSQPGVYFVTMVTQNRKQLFGHIAGGEMILSDAGRMVDQTCRELPIFMVGVQLKCFQVMPDHIHMMIEIEAFGNVSGANVGATLCGCPEGRLQRPVSENINRVSLPKIVARFKSLTTRRYIDGVNQNNWLRFENRLWQRNYYEHIVRTEQEHQRIIDYIQANPMNWEDHRRKG